MSTLTTRQVGAVIGRSTSRTRRLLEDAGIEHVPGTSPWQWPADAIDRLEAHRRWRAGNRQCKNYRHGHPTCPLQVDRTPHLFRHLEAMALRGLRETSIDQRERAVHRFRRAAGKDLLEATEDEVVDYYRGLGHLTPGSRGTELKHLRGYARWAVREQLIPMDPTIRLDVPRTPRRLPRPMSEKRLQQSMAAASPRLRAFLALGGYGGLRAGEIARLRREHVLDDLDEPVIFIAEGKGGHQRNVPLHSSAETPATTAGGHVH